MAPASRKTSQDHFFTPQSILLEIALFFQTLYFVVCFIMCVCMYVLSLLHLHCLSWIYIISIVDRGPTVGPTDGHGPGLFDLCTVAVRSRSGYLGLTAVHGPLKSSGPRQHWVWKRDYHQVGRPLSCTKIYYSYTRKISHACKCTRNARLSPVLPWLRRDIPLFLY